jgi:adenylylsulfate kinase
MTDTHLRSILKAISWRIFGTLVTMVFTFIITHQLTIALYIGLFEFVSKVFLFYLHERLWSGVLFGRKSKALPDSTI